MKKKILKKKIKINNLFRRINNVINSITPKYRSCAVFFIEKNISMLSILT